MKTLALFISILALPFLILAQKTDSVPFNGGQLYYHEYGQGKPIILLAGGPGISYHQQEEVAIRLGKTFHCILLEQRGTGNSVPAKLDTASINLRTAVSDLNLLLDHLKLKEAAFYGHSWGSLLAMYYASLYPQRVTQLVLAGPAPFNYTGDQMLTYDNNKYSRYTMNELVEMDSLATKSQKGTLTKEENLRVRVLNNRTNIANPEMVDSVMTHISVGKTNMKTMNLMMTNVYKSKLDLTEAISHFNKPIDIICGRQDALAFMAYEYKLIQPKVNVHWIQSAGHFAMFEQPDAFYKTLSEILK
ncbi:MAG: alpha/beta hydrolase [Chitinophagaceae bacterium]